MKNFYFTNKKETDYVQIYRKQLQMFLSKLKHGSQHANKFEISALKNMIRHILTKNGSS